MVAFPSGKFTKISSSARMGKLVQECGRGKLLPALTQRLATRFTNVDDLRIFRMDRSGTRLEMTKQIDTRTSGFREILSVVPATPAFQYNVIIRHTARHAIGH